jgi:hypothetical protein
MKTSTQFVQDWGIIAISEQVDKNLNNPAWLSANHYRVKMIYRHGAKHPQYTTYYSMGSALKGKPTAADVLLSLSMDIVGLKDSANFEDWAANYGYDSDSREAEKIFRTIEKQAEDVENWLPTAAYKQFLELREEE